MQKYIKKTLGLLMVFLLVLTSSCEDFLDRFPRASMADYEALSDIEGVEATIIGLYNRMQNGTYNHRDMNLVGEILSDQMDVAEAAYRFREHSINQEGSGFGLWNAIYDNINRCNMVLQYISDVEGNTERINHSKAQAYAMRGYFYFDLMKIYARPYMHQTPLVQGEPLGVIYKTTPFLGVDERAFQARGTIEEGYTLIKDDFERAFELFSEAGDRAHFRYPYRFTITSVKALLARLHLFMGNWDEAISYAEDVISEAPNSLAESESYFDAFASAPGVESILELNYATADDNPGQSSSAAGLAYYSPETAPYHGDIVLRNDLINLLEEYRDKGDVRPEMMFYRDKLGLEYAFQKKFASYRGITYLDNVRLIRMAEMYLIAAEGYAELEEFNNARDMLNELRAHRGSGDVTVDDNKEDFINLILDERRVEFFSEMSHRWFDLRRRGMDIPKGVPGEDSRADLGPIPFESYLLVERIPISGEIETNPNCIQNPGY